MVVTRKVRPKKDEPSTSEAVEDGDEEILPESEEPLSDAADDPGEAVEESIDIKAELAQSEPEDVIRPEGKRQPKPSFKVKYANTKLAGKKMVDFLVKSRLDIAELFDGND